MQNVCVHICRIRKDVSFKPYDLITNITPTSLWRTFVFLTSSDGITSASTATWSNSDISLSTISQADLNLSFKDSKPVRLCYKTTSHELSLVSIFYLFFHIWKLPSLFFLSVFMKRTAPNLFYVGSQTGTQADIIFFFKASWMKILLILEDKTFNRGANSKYILTVTSMNKLHKRSAGLF